MLLCKFLVCTLTKVDGFGVCWVGTDEGALRLRASRIV